MSERKSDSGSGALCYNDGAKGCAARGTALPPGRPVSKGEILTYISEMETLCAMAAQNIEVVDYVQWLNAGGDPGAYAGREKVEYNPGDILLVADNAAWHNSGALQVPENIQIYPLLPYTLN